MGIDRPKETVEEHVDDPNENKKKEWTGFEYLGPQSEHAGNLPELPRRLKAHPMPVEGKEPIKNFGNIDLHFTWPDLNPVKEPVDDEWAGKDYKHPGGAA